MPRRRRYIEYMKALLLLHTEEVADAILCKTEYCRKSRRYFCSKIYNSHLIKVTDGLKIYINYQYLRNINIDNFKIVLSPNGDGTYTIIDSTERKEAEYQYLYMMARYRHDIDTEPLDNLVSLVEELLGLRLEEVYL